MKFFKLKTTLSITLFAFIPTIGHAGLFTTVHEIDKPRITFYYDCTDSEISARNQKPNFSSCKLANFYEEREGATSDAPTKTIIALGKVRSTVAESGAISGGEISATTSELSTTVAEHEDKLADLIKDLEKTNDTVTKVKTKLDTASDSLKDSKTELSKISTKVGKNEDGIKKLNFEIDKSNDKIADLKTNLTKNTSAVEKMGAKVEKAVSDVKDLGIKVKTNADAIKATDTKVAKNLEGIATNKEAIAKNTSSIKATNDKIGNLIESLKAPTFEGKVTANGGIAVSKEFKVSSATEVSMGGNRVQNVADAVDNTDAVNLGQLKAESSRIFSNLDKKLSASTKKLSEDLEALKKESRAGSASAMATASLPQAWTPDQIGVGLGVATYRGAFGYSLGVSAMSGDEAWVGKASVSGDSKGGFGGSLGMMFSF